MYSCKGRNKKRLKFSIAWICQILEYIHSCLKVGTNCSCDYLLVRKAIRCKNQKLTDFLGLLAGVMIDDRREACSRLLEPSEVSLAGVDICHSTKLKSTM